MKKPGKIIRKWFHQISATIAYLRRDENSFMNLGYLEENEQFVQSHVYLQENLYLRLIHAAKDFFQELNVKSALEIGCGRGGGSQLLKIEWPTANVVGLDRVCANVLMAHRQFRDIEFVKADACNFNLHRKFELVLNLESAHAYTDLQRFVDAVKKHINPGGVFAFGDLMSSERSEIFLRLCHEAGFVLVYSENISARVVDSLRLRNKLKSGLLLRYPHFFPGIVHNFFVTTRSRTFHRLMQGNFVYLLFVFKYFETDK